MFSLLGYRFENDLLVILLSTCSWRPVVWCCQRDVRWQVLWGQKEIAVKEEIELFTFGKGLERVWTALFKPLTFLSNKRRISYQEKCLILPMSDKKSQLFPIPILYLLTLIFLQRRRLPLLMYKNVAPGNEIVFASFSWIIKYKLSNE